MPDYEGSTPEAAMKDFRERIAAYVSVYEMMGADKAEQDLSWVRVEDGGRFVAMNRIRGYLQHRLVAFLSTLHTVGCFSLFFSRFTHGVA
jgi:6-phosphofructo-2-kinase/fructose-2,6-biphosphatase 2